MRKFCLQLLIALVLVTSAKETHAEPVTLTSATVVATAISIAKTSVGFLGGDVQGALLSGNRKLLIELDKKLDQHERRLKAIQEELTFNLKKDFSELLDKNDVKNLTYDLNSKLLKLKKIENDYTVETNNKVKLAWKNHYDRLVELESELIELLFKFESRDNNPLLMVGNSAVYALLLQVQGQIIAIRRSVNSLDDSIVKEMGFAGDHAERTNELEAALEKRIKLARTAKRRVTMLLEEPLLKEISDRINLLRELDLEEEVSLKSWFPAWLNSEGELYPTQWLNSEGEPDNFPIYHILSDIAYDLGKECKGEYVSEALDWLKILLFDYGGSPENGRLRDAIRKADMTEKDCGLNEELFSDLRLIPFHEQRMWGISFFRTPAYTNIISKEYHTPLFGRSREEWTFERRQYEFKIMFRKIPRSHRVSNDSSASNANPLPGLDMVSRISEKELPNYLKPEVRRSLGFSTDRRKFWWDGGSEFEVHYIEIRGLGKKKGSFPRWTLDIKYSPKVRFIKLVPDHSNPKLSRMIFRNFQKMLIFMNLPESYEVPLMAYIAPGWLDHHVPNVEWKPKHTPRVDFDPEIWATTYNHVMAYFEFLLRIQAELEFYFIAFHDFEEQLNNSEMPELNYAISPGEVAALISMHSNSNQWLAIRNFLSQNAASVAIAADMESTIVSTEKIINEEAEKERFKRNLMLSLAVAELAVDLAPTIKDWLDEIKNKKESYDEFADLSIETIDLEDLTEEQLNVLLNQIQEVEQPNSKQLKRHHPPPPKDSGEVVSSTPILNLLGGSHILKAGKAAIVGIKSGGRVVAQIIMRRTVKSETAVLVQQLSQKTLRKNGKSVVLINNLIRNNAGIIKKGYENPQKLLQEAIKNNEKYVNFGMNNYKKIVAIGKDFVCAGAKQCHAAFETTTYGGALLKNGQRQFRIGIKKNANQGPQANFEVLNRGTNVHFNFLGSN